LLPCEVLSAEKPGIDLDGKTVLYAVRVSLKARHVRLEVRPETGLTVVIPREYPLSKLPDLIQGKRRWVLSKLEMYGEARRKYAANVDTACYLGRELRISALPDGDNPAGLSFSGDELLLHLKTEEDNRRSIEFWLRSQAGLIIKELAEKHSLKIGVKYSALRIRSARTRWGSCSPSGAISFNWKLIMAPLPVIEYVVIHELCHLRELKHSKRFWGMVGAFCPDWRAHRKWLRNNEAALAYKSG